MDEMAPAYHHHLPYYTQQPPPPPPPPGVARLGPPPPTPTPPPPPPYSHHPHHPPAFQSVVYGTHSSPSDEVRTLFIAGLPNDVKHREIYNLFREFSGFQSCQLRCSGRSSQAFAFAVFADQQSAVAAMHSVNGLKFDLDTDLALHVDLAKSNSRSKRLRTDELSYNSKKSRESSMYHEGLGDSGIGSDSHMPGMGNTAHDTNYYTSTQSYIKFGYEGVDDSVNKKEPPTGYVSQNNAPCPTLFVANLGPNCSEQELAQIFSSFPGFIKLKMQKKHGVPVAFVDFQDVACSSRALKQLQGYMLYSSAEGMRLEYAKSRMGLRRHERA